MKIKLTKTALLMIIAIAFCTLATACASQVPATAEPVAAAEEAASEADETAAASEETDHVDVEGASQYAHMNSIFGRVTAREFSADAVTDEELEMLLAAAFSAATGGNQRSNELMVVTDRDMMTAMQEGHPYSQPLDTAPLVIVIGANTETALYPEILTLDAGIAAEAIMVQASEMGLVSVPMSIMPQEERIMGITNAIGNPTSVVPQIMVAIGHPLTDEAAHASTDFYDETKVHMNGWNK